MKKSIAICALVAGAATAGAANADIISDLGMIGPLGKVSLRPRADVGMIDGLCDELLHDPILETLHTYPEFQAIVLFWIVPSQSYRPPPP